MWLRLSELFGLGIVQWFDKSVFLITGGLIGVVTSATSIIVPKTSSIICKLFFDFRLFNGER